MPQPASPVLLLVEDDPFVGLALSHYVCDLGCVPVGPAASVAAALRLIRSERLDGAVLDVDLGGETSPIAEALWTCPVLVESV